MLTILSISIILSAIFVISSPNPIHSVFHLIFVFIQFSIYFFVLGLDYMGIIFIIVYVGAIAILFLFVVMLLNLKLISFKEFIISLPLASFLGLIFLIILYFFIDFSPSFNASYLIWDTSIISLSSFKHLSIYLFSQFFVPFILSALVLFIATIGAVYLTYQFNPSTKHQNVNYQIFTKIH